MINKTTIRQVFILAVLALFLRIFNFSSPAFTTDDARIAFRGYLLSKDGVDELGRRLPFLFNSLEDYQLPLVSYISAGGAIFLDKSDLGARLPFIIIGLVLVLLTYKVAFQISKEKYIGFLSSFIVATSPVLIFVSKIPNEPIVVTTLLLLLFYLLNKDRLNLILIFLTIIFLIATSKFAWFILAPFVIYTVFIYRNILDLRDKLKLSLISLTFTTLAFTFFLQVPQGTRSLSENNFTIFSDITIKNGIDKLRGQGLQSGWPQFADRILFNKAYFLTAGFVHWLSNISPAIYFGQFDKSGQLNFSQMGALNKVLIIPFVWGLIYLVRKGRKKEKLLLVYFIILTFPAIFIYPDFSQSLIVLILPFAAFVTAFGFMQFNRILSLLIILVMVLELGLNLFYLAPEKKNTNLLRPEWIKPIAQEAFNLSDTDQVLISDDIAQDITSFIGWYTPFNPEDAFLDIPYPYKFRQTNLGRIKLVGASDSFRSCGLGENTKFFSSKRDLNRVRDLNSIQVTNTYLDSREEVAAYFIERGVCIN